MRTIILLTISNIFMTFAWYGHLKYRNVALWKIVAISWVIAFFEYCFQVPANRLGSYEFRATQNHSGSHYPLRFFHLLHRLSGRAAEVELRRGIRLHRPCGVFCFSPVVN